MPKDKNSELLRRCQCQIKYTSKYDGEKGSEYMTESSMQVIRFETVVRKFVEPSRRGSLPCAVDALYLSGNGHAFFIEFKSGKLMGASGKGNDACLDVKLQALESLLLFADLEDMDVKTMSTHASFILVYNEDKNPPKDENSGLPDSPSMRAKTAIGRHRAKAKVIRFGFERFERHYFQHVLTLNPCEFQDYIKGWGDTSSIL